MKIKYEFADGAVSEVEVEETTISGTTNGRGRPYSPRPKPAAGT